jgi:uncharacterized protein YxeA
MTPKEKAIELVNSFDTLGRDFTRGVSMKEFAKGCASRTVDEIIEEYGTYFKVNVEDKYVSYWEQVKQEIQKL